VHAGIALAVLPGIHDPLTVGVIRTDNGGKFTSHSFYNYLLASGTRIERSAPNGDGHVSIAERAIQTIKAIARASIIDADLPNGFFGDACL
jgi:hypothetical protein